MSSSLFAQIRVHSRLFLLLNLLVPIFLAVHSRLFLLIFWIVGPIFLGVHSRLFLVLHCWPLFFWAFIRGCFSFRIVGAYFSGRPFAVSHLVG
jgi:hypothetical protein